MENKSAHLYRYQEKAVEALVNGKHLCIAGVGLGKSAIALTWASRQNKSKVLVITTASKRDTRQPDGRNDFELDADTFVPGWRQSLSSFETISWQGLVKWYSEHKYDLSDYAIIGDECLPADTKVMTSSGEKEIADIKVGDKVLSYNHITNKTEYKTVTRLIRKPSPNKMYRLLSNERAIISTGNHPHYTHSGYKEADSIKKGDTLYELHNLPKNCIVGESDAETKRKIQKNWKSLLFKRVPNERSLEIWKRITETEKSCSARRNYPLHHLRKTHNNKRPVYAQGVSLQPEWKDLLLERMFCYSNTKSKRERDYYASGTWDYTSLGETSRVTRRERKLHQTTNIPLQQIERSVVGVGDGANCSSPSERERVSLLLQSRCREQLLQDSDRVRREITQFEQSKSTRQEERGQIKPVRVESVEILELADIKQFGFYRDPDYVYCIDVEDNHNFFANGFLTHNCAMAKAGISSQRGKAFLKIAQATDCWTGYTATPGDSYIDFYAYFVAAKKIANKTTFMRRFCNVQTYRGFPQIVSYYETETLDKWWREIAEIVDGSEAEKEIPDEVHKTVRFPVPKGYKQVLKTRCRLEDGEFMETSGALCAYLRGMCASPERVRWVQEFVENLGESCVMFYNLIKEGDAYEEAIKKALPKGAKVWRIDGKNHTIPTKDTIGPRDIVLVQYQAGSMGLNLQAVSVFVALSLPYSYSVYSQALGRIRRIGQKHTMFFYTLLSEGTIESDIVKCLKEKRTFAEREWCIEKGINNVDK